MYAPLGRHAPLSLALLASAALLAACGGDGGGNDDGNPTPTTPTAASACAAVSGQSIGGSTALVAAAVPASGAVPTYCKVNGTLFPNLNFEIRLPDTWNGKLHYGGGGGYNGAIPDLTGANLAALNKGFATVSSDSGHQANFLDASFALNADGSIDTTAAENFGSLSVPKVMAAAQEIVRTALGSLPQRSYFEGCSNGGREGLMAVQRNPELFDGVISRAPAYNWVGVMGAFNRNAKLLAAPGGQFSAAKVRLLAQAVRESCDELDGIIDGVVSNPTACAAEYDPTVLRCAGGADTGDTCLSDAQLAVVQSWTTPISFPASPTYRNPGWPLTGNEDDPGAWNAWLTGNANYTSALQYLFQDTTVKNYLARNRAVNSLTWGPLDQDPAALNTLATLNDATNADIRPFLNSGGKLLLWHGGNDSALSVNATADYYTSMVAAVGGQAVADQSVRFYVAPGVNHCAGGPGADSADLLAALDGWVTAGTAPGTLTASKVAGNGSTLFTRPLCQWPQYPRYTGPAGNAQAATLASNYTCTSP